MIPTQKQKRRTHSQWGLRLMWDMDAGSTGPAPSPPPNPPPTCKSSGTLYCGSKSYAQYKCSPPVTTATPATLTQNDFSEGGDGGGASECDGKFHSNSELIVALSTGWYNGGSRCYNKGSRFAPTYVVGTPCQGQIHIFSRYVVDVDVMPLRWYHCECSVCVCARACVSL